MQSVEINIFTDWIFKKIKTQLPTSTNWATELIIIMRHHPIPSSLLSLHHTWIFHPAFSDLPSIFDDIWEGQKLSLCFWAISRLSSTAEPSFSVCIEINYHRICILGQILTTLLSIIIFFWILLTTSVPFEATCSKLEKISHNSNIVRRDWT